MVDETSNKFVGTPDAWEALGDSADVEVVHGPQCLIRQCVHYLGLASDGQQGRPVCKAFPDGIPDEIAFGDNLHLTRFPGDRGIRFARKKPEPEPAGV